MSEISQVIDQMQANGLPLLTEGHPVLDGRIHRFGRRKKAWYALREIVLRSGKAVITGAFGIWQGENNNAVSVRMDWTGVSPEERAAAELKQREHEAREKAKRERLAEFAASRAKQQWDSARPRKGSLAVSAYLERKQVEAINVRVSAEGVLLVPMVKYWPGGKKLVGLQKIAPDGVKLFNKGMDKSGARCMLARVTKETPLVMIGEGYATVASAFMSLPEADRSPAIVAFDAGNLLSVAQDTRRMAPDAHILFLADDDWPLEARLQSRLREDYQVQAPEIDGEEHVCTADDGSPVQVTVFWKEDEFGDRYIGAHIRRGQHLRTIVFRNTGVYCAKAAAKAVGNASVVIPIFGDRGDNKWTDFNDLHVHESLDAVRLQVVAAIDQAGQKGRSGNVVQFPSPPDKKQGADPEKKGKSEKKENSGRKKKEYGDAFWKTVDYLLENFTLIYGDDVAWDAQKRILIQVKNMRIAFGGDAVKFWLANGDRKMVDKVVFDPTFTADPEKTVNLYHGFKIKPKKGDCTRILGLLHHLCDHNEEIIEWVLRWIAYPLQHPGAKMRSSVIMHGDEGSGKNLFWEVCVGGIYGEYSNVIGNAQIESSFNEWASKKLFMVADEVVTRAELRQLKGKLRNLVTGETVNINPKGMNERVEANHMNFVFLSNELQPLALDKSDRRYLVIWTPPKLEDGVYKAVGEQIRGGGIEAFYHYLLHEVDLGDFDEHTKPMMNTAKSRLISLGLSPTERFYREWFDGFLPLPVMPCTAEQLYLGFLRWCTVNGERYPDSQTFFGRRIDRMGYTEGVRRAIIRCSVGSVRKQRTVYLVGSKPEHKSREEWVDGASEMFERDLRRYRNVFDQQQESE